MIRRMDVDAYLNRIGATHRGTSLESLEHLQRAHLTAVPFENLDVFHRRGVQTSPEWSIAKIVDRRRGGWCYELNGAFAELLQALGFEVTLLACHVLFDGEPTEEPDHLALLVETGGPHLVDVGFGNSFIRPLPLLPGVALDGGSATYSFEESDGNWTLREHASGGDAVPQYRFKVAPADHTDFEVASQRLQTVPGLHWTAAPFCTRLLEGGPDRVTLLSDRIRWRRGNRIIEEPVAAESWAATLHEWFGLSP